MQKETLILALLRLQHDVNALEDELHISVLERTQETQRAAFVPFSSTG